MGANSMKDLSVLQLFFCSQISSKSSFSMSTCKNPLDNIIQFITSKVTRLYLGKNGISKTYELNESSSTGTGKIKTTKDLARTLGKLYVVYTEVILKFEIHISIFFRYIIIKYSQVLNYSFILFRNNNIRTTFSNLALDS